MKIVAIVPIKLNNRRCPNKNIRPFTNGEPLCTYILNTLMKVKEISEVYVYCSSPEIIKYLPGGVKYKKRSSELDLDTTKMNEVLKCFSEEIAADIYVMSHATSPFVKACSIERGINAVLSGEFDSAFAAKKMQDFMWQEGKPLNYQLDNIPRTQDLEPILVETSGFYIYRSSIIKEWNRRIGNNPYIVEVSDIESTDIDEPIDFVIADALYNYMKVTGE